MTVPELKNLLKISDTELAQDILNQSQITFIPEEKIILSEGDYVRHVPLVLSGVIKVFTTYHDRDLLLYYIEPGQSCIMSINAVINTDVSQVNAVTETPVKVMLLPAESLRKIFNRYPHFQTVILSWYNVRYHDLLHTIQHLIFDKLDVRVLNYLKTKQQVLQKDTVKITHQQIAQELGTVREVISRILKKLENQGDIKLTKDGIKISS